MSGQWSSSSVGSSSRRPCIGDAGRIQLKGVVVHLVADHLSHLSAMRVSVGGHEGAFLLPHGRGDEARRGGGGLDLRDLPAKGPRSRDTYIPDLHIDRIKSLDFR